MTHDAQSNTRDCDYCHGLLWQPSTPIKRKAMLFAGKWGGEKDGWTLNGKRRVKPDKDNPDHWVEKEVEYDTVEKCICSI